MGIHTVPTYLSYLCIRYGRYGEVRKERVKTRRSHVEQVIEQKQMFVIHRGY
jgi:hypothetical protein